MGTAAGLPVMDQWRTHLRSHFAGGAFELPVLPDVAVKILQSSNDTEVDIDELCELILRDQILASHVIRLANSALFSMGRKINSLEQALLRLGLFTLRELVSAVAFRSRLFSVPEYEALGEELWRTSAATGAFCREIATLRQCDRERMFLCGLLHAVGKPVALLGILDVKKKHALPLDIPTTVQLMEEFHVDVGGQLATKWSLPDAVIEVIGCYQHPEMAEHFRDEASTVALARFLALAAIGAKEDTPAPEAPIVSVGIGQEDYESLWSKRDKVISFATALGGN
jgi:HD-like signal output (HDOD) protein